MAGFFGFFDYNKPGPGVPKDAPPKPPILLFFELLQRKFWNIIKLSLMINVFNIPAFLLGMFVMLTFFPDIRLAGITDESSILTMQLALKFVFVIMMMSIPLVTVGPAQAGFTYVLRNYAREEPTFIWSDFKDNAKLNMKQSIVVCIIDFFAAFLMLWSMLAYQKLSNQNAFFTVGFILTFLLFLVFVLMHIYIYPLMVTFKLTLKELYKNAFLFAFLKLPMNIVIVLLCAFIILLSFGGIIAFNIIIGMVIYFFLTPGLIGFITNFYAYPKLKKYMMPPDADEDEEEEDEEAEEAEEDIVEPAGELPEGKADRSGDVK